MDGNKITEPRFDVLSPSATRTHRADWRSRLGGIWPASARLTSDVPSDAHRLFLQWLALAGLLLAAAVLLGRLGVWRTLISADPTWLTVVIIILFASATLWCGRRAWVLADARRRLDLFQSQLAIRSTALSSGAAGHEVPHGTSPIGAAIASSGIWIEHYFSMLLAKGFAWRENAQLTDWLAEYAHGPHETAWWVNGIQLKLGLLGKVIGFSVLALDLGAMESFDVSQSQALLKALTGGLGIALLTTMTGLVGNILLGLQLTRLDRYADLLVADALRIAESDLSVLALSSADAGDHADRH